MLCVASVELNAGGFDGLFPVGQIGFLRSGQLSRVGANGLVAELDQFVSQGRVSHGLHHGFFQAVEWLALQAGWAVHGKPSGGFHVDAGLLESRHFRHLRVALWAGHGDDAHLLVWCSSAVSDTTSNL